MGMSSQIFSTLASFEQSSDPDRQQIYRLFLAIKETLEEKSRNNHNNNILNNPNGYFLATLEFMFSLLDKFSGRSDSLSCHQQLNSGIQFITVLMPFISSPIVLKSREQFMLLLDGLLDLAIVSKSDQLLKNTLKCFSKASKHHFRFVWFEGKNEISQFYEKLLGNIGRSAVTDCLKEIPNAYGLFLKFVCSVELKSSNINGILGILNCLSEIHQMEFSLDLLSTAIEKVYQFNTVDLEIEKSISILRLLCLFCRFANSTEEKEFISKWIKFFGDIYDSVEANLKNEIVSFLKASIHCLNSRLFFSHFPLNWDGQEDKRVWLVRIIKNAIVGDEIGFFFEQFLPIIEELMDAVRQFSDNGKIIDAKVHSMLIDQIWDLFPSYCSYPVDFDREYERVFTHLQNGIETGDIPSNVICNSINNLISSTYKSTEPKCVEISTDLFDRNLSSIITCLFNKYTTLPLNERGLLLDCLKNCFSIGKSDQIEELFKSCLKNLLSASQESLPNPLRVNALLDVVIAVIPLLSDECKQLSFKYFLAQFKTAHRLESDMEKKTYKALSELLKCSSQELTFLFTEPLNQIALCDSCVCKQSRLAFLMELIKIHPFPRLQSLSSAILPELLVGTKEMSEKSRQLAIDALLLLGLRYRDEHKQMQEFEKLLISGLAGKSPLMISATISCIGLVCIEFRLTHDEILYFLHLFLSLHTLESNEILRAVFDFLKITFKIVPDEKFKDQLASIIPILMEWSGRASSTLRTAIKNLIEKFIRRWGYDYVQQLLPPNYLAVVRNIRKKNNRKQRQRHQHEEGDVSDESEEDAFVPKALQPSLIAYDQDGLAEQNNGIPVDLLNKQQLLTQIASQPKKKRPIEESDDDEVTFNQDGKLQLNVNSQSKCNRQCDEQDESEEEKITSKQQTPSNKQPSHLVKRRKQQQTVDKKQPQSVSFIPLRNTVRTVKSKVAAKAMNHRYHFN